MIEIRNDKLVINDRVIGDEEKLMAIGDKAKKYDELKATIFGGDLNE